MRPLRKRPKKPHPPLRGPPSPKGEGKKLALLTPITPNAIDSDSEKSYNKNKFSFARKLMSYEYNKDLKQNAQRLRKNMTKEEKHLWYDFLKMLPVTVHRQKNIGDYIVDFYIPAKKTVIEIDGKQHRLEKIAEKDLQRQEYLENLGLTVIRISNSDINVRFKEICDCLNNLLEL